MSIGKFGLKVNKTIKQMVLIQILLDFFLIFFTSIETFVFDASL